MSSLGLIEKRQLELLFKMSDGFVLNFSDSTISDFFIDAVGIDIHSKKYQATGTSKAKKLREFWNVEPDHIVGKAILSLIDYIEAFLAYDDKKDLIASCRSIGNRLLSGTINLDSIKKTTVSLDAKNLNDQIRRMEQSVDTDPSLAIGTAKELIETCCKTILTERGKTIPNNLKMPTLVRETIKELKLAPEDVPETARGSDIIKNILHNLSTIGIHISELRGLYGTGHGKIAKEKGLMPRHARLAVGAASTLVTFLFETNKEKKS